MGLDTKIYWLTLRQSQLDFDFDNIRDIQQADYALVLVASAATVL
jgi:hypothetical protein